MPFRLHFQIHLTDDCNQRCLHCYSTNREYYLDREQFDHILNEVLVYMESLAMVPGRAIFCGGEPTLSPILLDCMRKCSKAGFRWISLLTNGMSMSPAFARELLKAGCTRAQICIEGARETHNAIRNGSWDQVLRAWETCRRIGLPVVNQTTLHPLNCGQVDEVVQICQGKVDHVSFLRHVPHERDLGILSPSQWMDVLKTIYLAYYRDGQYENPFVSVKDIHWSHIFLTHTYHCDYMGRYPKTPIIDCNGDVYVCRRSNVVLGNVFRESLMDIFQTSKTLAQIRDRQNLNPRCRSCPRLDVCGGCRGMALAVHGDMMAEDPQCCLQEPSDGNTREFLRQKMNKMLPTFTGDISESFGKMFMKLIESLREFRSSPPTLRERRRIIRAAKKKGLSLSLREVQRTVDNFRAACGLNKAEDTKQWLRSHRISLEQFQDYLTFSLIQDKVENRLRASNGVPD